MESTYLPDPALPLCKPSRRDPVKWHPDNSVSSCTLFTYSGSNTPPDSPETPAYLQRAPGYVGLATVEFMVGADGDFILLEVNPRLQVSINAYPPALVCRFEGLVAL